MFAHLRPRSTKPSIVSSCLPIACAGILFSVTTTISAGTVDLKLMTFNIKGDTGSLNNQLNENGWLKLINQPNRSLKAISVIGDYAPDILASQESESNQINDLLNAFPEYSSYGLGRNANGGGEHVTIFYRTDRFTALDQGDFWLSDTPTVPGTTFTGNGSDTGNPRHASWMKLFDNQSNQTYFVLNTHWSLDSLARTQSAALIREQIDLLSDGLPLLVLGDFNTTLSSTALRTLTGVNLDGFDLSDAYRTVYPTSSSREATYHNFTGGEFGSSIDHIFYTASVFTPTDAEIVRTNFNGLYPSDHFPVTSTLSVQVVPEIGSGVLAALGLGALLLIRRRGFLPFAQ